MGTDQTERYELLDKDGFLIEEVKDILTYKMPPGDYWLQYTGVIPVNPDQAIKVVQIPLILDHGKALATFTNHLEYQVTVKGKSVVEVVAGIAHLRQLITRETPTTPPPPGPLAQIQNLFQRLLASIRKIMKV